MVALDRPPASMQKDVLVVVISSDCTQAASIRLGLWVVDACVARGAYAVLFALCVLSEVCSVSKDKRGRAGTRGSDTDRSLHDVFGDHETEMVRPDHPQV